jgi:hypothetical protein
MSDMTLRMHSVYGFIWIFLLSLIFPWGGLCGGREEVLAKGWTLDLLIERFNQDEKVSIAYDLEHPSSKNWGGDGPYFSRLFGMIEKLGDRAALPFLKEKSLMTNAPGFIRARAARAYASLATGEECAVLLPEMLKIDNQTVWTAGWRSGTLFLYLNRINDAIAKGELSDEAVNLLVGKLLAHTQSLSVPRVADGDMIDRFLIQHCAGYATSRQRLAMWTEYLDELGDESWDEDLREKFTPTKESLEAIPPRKRTDLRKRFPELPPLPDDAPAGGCMKVAIAVVVGIVAVVAAWITLRRRKARKAA